MSFGTVQAEKMTTESGYSLGAGNASSFKNRIINGAMVIDQRNAGAEVNPAVNNTYYLDRWYAVSTAASKFKIGQNAGGVTPPAGFKNYLGCTSLSAYSLGSSEAFGVRQVVEGLNFADLGWGTANAQTITISFWVRSSLTGTFGVGLGNYNFSRAYAASYTINSANTWEQKTITITGDTSGTWLSTNDIGLYLTWSLGYSSNLTGTAGVWNAGSYFMPTGATSVVGTNGATFYLTGVQLEVGTVATSFDFRSIGTELDLCYRYCQIINGKSAFSNAFSRYIIFGTASTGALWMPTFPTPMRIPPSLLTKDFNASTVDFYNYNTTVTPPFSSVVISEGDLVHAQVSIAFSSGSGVGNMLSWRWSGNPDAYIGFSAEL